MASSSSSLLLRLISHKGFSVSSSYHHCNLGKWTPTSSVATYWFNRRGLTTTTTTTTTAPLLMLPPEFDNAGVLRYKFYSLSENKVQTLSPSPRDVIRLKCRGSSHGWLALLSPHRDVFLLYNPITHRHIKLPSIDDLPRTRDYNNKDISKFILSCSPDEDEENCRVVISTGDANVNPLAYCCPGRSKKWTLISNENRLTGVENRGMRRQYIDCVYSTAQKLFFGLTGTWKLETWDLGDEGSPRLINRVCVKMLSCYNFDGSPRLIDIVNVEMSNRYNYYTTENKSLMSLTKKHLVVANQDDFLLVNQYMKLYVGPDGSCFDNSDEGKPDNCHRMTVDFEVFKYDPKEVSFDRCSSSLDGLALFLGDHSDSVAVPASRFPGLKPNSVYFTDIFTEMLSGYFDDSEKYGTGYDIGIFSCENNTVSRCYYPCDAPSLRKILPAPKWFFPSRPV